jgi:hypothetical protein
MNCLTAEDAEDAEDCGNGGEDFMNTLRDAPVSVTS